MSAVWPTMFLLGCSLLGLILCVLPVDEEDDEEVDRGDRHE